MSRSRPAIFDSVQRVDSSYGRHSESNFHFLNRVAGDYWEHSRALIQGWADRIRDNKAYVELRSHLRSGDGDKFRSALLELYIHECLLRAGYNVTVHPDLPHSPRRPDFHARRDDEELYVEAIAPGTRSDQKGGSARRAVLIDAVDKLQDPNFLLAVSEIEVGKSAPSGAKLRRELASWLASLDPDSFTSLANAPQYPWTEGGWSATFRALPKRLQARGIRPNERAIAVHGYEAGFEDFASTIRKAVVGKHQAYGSLHAPFVVAVGTYIIDTDRWHSTNAFYGHEAIELTEDANGELTLGKSVRQRDGYFGSPGAWKNQNVSGVLVVNQLAAWSVLKAEATLWRHPNAAHSLPALKMPWDTVDIVEGRLIVSPPENQPADFFGLSEPWPPGERW